MPTRTLHGWTPGNPIDGQRMRIWKGSAPGFPGALAGTYDMSASATSVQVSVTAGAFYSGELRSFRELAESNALTVVFYVPSGMGMMAPSFWQWQGLRFLRWLLAGLFASHRLNQEYVPPPTGTISVSDP